MELASVTFWQVVTLFALIFTGASGVRSGVLPKEAKPILSNLLLYIILPAMTLNSYMTDYDPETGRNISRAFLYSIAALSMGVALTMLLFRDKNNRNLPLCRFACIFSNAAYMGYPLIHALFGDEGLMYASAYVTVFNILLWTLGIGLVGRPNSLGDIRRNILRTPVLYAVLAGLMIYYLRIPTPQVIRTAVGYLGAMNTPISMMITGMLIVGSNVPRLLRDGRLWRTIGVRLLVIPAACVAAFLALGIRGTVAQVILLQEACPCAAITSVLAVQFHHEEDFAGGLVVLSTLLSVVTLPVCALLLTM